MSTAAVEDQIAQLDRVYLEKLRLAAAVILKTGEDELINTALETQLHLFKDMIERALLLPESTVQTPNPRDARNGDGPAV